MAIKLILAAILTGLTSQSDAGSKFGEVLDQAIKRSVELPVADSDIESKSAQRLSSRLRLLPKLSLGASQTDNYGPTHNTLQYSASASWSQFSGLYEMSLWKRQSLEERESHLNRKLKVLEVEKNVSLALFEYLRQWQLLKAREKKYQFTKDSQKITQKLYSRGRVSLEELTRAKLTAKIAHIGLIDQKRQLNRSLATLREWIEEQTPEPQWPFKSLGPDAFKGDTQIDVEAHPRILAALLNQGASRETVSLAKSRFLPQASLSLTRNYFPDISGGEYESVALLSVSLPLFDSGEDYAQIKKSRVEVLRSQSQLLLARRNLLQRAKASLENYKLASMALVESDEGLKLAGAMMKTSSRHYSKGVVNFNHYGQDLERFLQAYTQNAQSLYEFHVQVLERCQLKGMRLVNCLGL